MGATPAAAIRRAAMPAEISATRRAVIAGWRALPPSGRFGLLGVLASAVVAIALGLFIPLEVRRHLLEAEGRGLEAAVVALQPSLPDLSSGPLSSTEISLTDRLVDRAILDSDHVRAKLWALDGTVLYSDAGELIGRVFADVRPRLDEVAASGTMHEVTDLHDAENELERQYPRLIEFYVPVRDDGGRTVAVFEIYEDVGFLEQALTGISSATWLAIGSGLTILLLFLLTLVAAAVRSISRDRAAAEARAGELAILVGAAEAVASSLEPAEIFSLLGSRVSRGLALSRLTIEPSQATGPGVLSFQLGNGTWLVAERTGGTLADEDARVLRSVANNLGVALANAALYAEVRDAAQARRALLRQVVQAHEDERRHLVGELHDSLAGDLIRVLYGLRGIRARASALSDDIRAELAGLEERVSAAERGLRAFMTRVRPASLDEFGLATALEEAVAQFRGETGLDVRLRVSGGVSRVSPDRQLVVLRAAEEALLNVRKHAHAARVRVSVRVGEARLGLTVDDDGVGWPAQLTSEAGRGVGLAYLRERTVGFGGAIRQERSRLGGARLVVDLPLGAA